MSSPRDKFFTSLEPDSIKDFERFYLNVAVWPGKKDPSADVIRIQLTGLKNEKWETIKGISIYRDSQGYRELPPAKPQIQKQEDTETVTKEEYLDDFSEESEDKSVPEEEE